MPYKVKKQGNRYHVVKAHGKSGKSSPMKKGGHETKAAATKQARAVNASLKRKGRI